MSTTFDGETFNPAQDGPRLTTQLARVKALMSDGRWRTLAAIARIVGGSEAGVSARLRDLIKPRFGGHSMEKRRLYPGSATWEYRVTLRKNSMKHQEALPL